MTPEQMAPGVPYLATRHGSLAVLAWRSTGAVSARTVYTLVDPGSGNRSLTYGPNPSITNVRPAAVLDSARYAESHRDDQIGYEARILWHAADPTYDQEQ